MRVEINLYASFRSKLPEDSEGSTSVMEMHEGASVADLMLRLELDKTAKLVFVNGLHAQLSKELREGDRVAVFPPIAGG